MNGECSQRLGFRGANLNDVRITSNTAMAKFRISVEWYCIEVKRFLEPTGAKQKFRNGQMPAGIIYRAAVLFTNLQLQQTRHYQTVF